MTRKVLHQIALLIKRQVFATRGSVAAFSLGFVGEECHPEQQYNYLAPDGLSNQGGVASPRRGVC